MAGCGMPADGIANEVGNTLSSNRPRVQMLQRRDRDGYTREKLVLVNDQLKRIQTTLRELVNFSRPASREPTRVKLDDILDEAWNIAKYYKRTKGRIITLRVEPGLPLLHGVRDQLVQVFRNLILNAIDATARGGHIEVAGARKGGEVEVTVRDDGT